MSDHLHPDGDRVGDYWRLERDEALELELAKRAARIREIHGQCTRTEAEATVVVARRRVRTPPAAISPTHRSPQRARRPRAHATRSSSRSGDSGDDDASSEPAAPRLALAAPPRAVLTFGCLPAERRGEISGYSPPRSIFDALHAATPHLTGAERLSVFLGLDDDVQRHAWSQLAIDCAARRRAA